MEMKGNERTESPPDTVREEGRGESGLSWPAEDQVTAVSEVMWLPDSGIVPDGEVDAVSEAAEIFLGP